MVIYLRCAAPFEGTLTYYMTFKERAEPSKYRADFVLYFLIDWEIIMCINL